MVWHVVGSPLAFLIYLTHKAIICIPGMCLQAQELKLAIFLQVFFAIFSSCAMHSQIANRLKTEDTKKVPL